MACLFQKIVSFDKESYFCIETCAAEGASGSARDVEARRIGLRHRLQVINESGTARYRLSCPRA